MKEPVRRLQCWAWRGLQAVYALSLGGLLALPTHRYAWMRAFDPVAADPLPEDGSGNRAVAVAVLLAVALAAQLLSAWTDATPRRRWLAAALGAVALGLAMGRFGLP